MDAEKLQRISFDFPREIYPTLKMICAEKRMNLKDFATDAIKRAVNEYIEQKNKEKQ